METILEESNHWLHHTCAGIRTGRAQISLTENRQQDIISSRGDDRDAGALPGTMDSTLHEDELYAAWNNAARDLPKYIGSRAGSGPPLWF